MGKRDRLRRQRRRRHWDDWLISVCAGCLGWDQPAEIGLQVSRDGLTLLRFGVVCGGFEGRRRRERLFRRRRRRWEGRR